MLDMRVGIVVDFCYVMFINSFFKKIKYDIIFNGLVLIVLCYYIFDLLLIEECCII